MNLVKLVEVMENIGLPFVYSHWPDNSVPALPFLTYVVIGSDNYKADNKTFHKVTDINIELYTSRKDLITESKIEKALDDHNIPYDTTDAFIDAEKVFQKTYEVRLI